MRSLSKLLLLALFASAVALGGCGLAGLGSTAGVIYALVSMGEEEEEEPPPPPVTVIPATLSGAGPEGGRVTALACDDTQTPDCIYAGTFRAGMFKSVDAGATWAAFNTGFNRNLSVTDVVIDPGQPLTVYASTGRPYAGGVFVTVNGGTLWTQRNQGLTHVDVRCLASPATNEIYAGTGGAGLFVGTVATGGVVTWVQAGSTGLYNQTVNCIRISGTDVFVCTEGGGVFYHDDSASPLPSAWTWTAVNKWLPTLFINCIEIDGTNLTLWAGTAGSSVYEMDFSTGAPASWSWTALSPVSTGNVIDLKVEPASPLNMYVATTNGIVLSTDGGTNWVSPTTAPVDWAVQRLCINPGTFTTIYAGGYSGGFYSSTNSGDDWTASNTGLIAGDFASAAVDQTSTVNATVFGGMWMRSALGSSRGAYKTTDGGSTWPSISDLTTLAGRDIREIVIDPAATTTVYAATGSDGVFETTNGGTTWAQSNTGLGSNTVLALAIAPSTPLNLYAGTSVGLFRTTDGAATWFASATQPPPGRVTLGLGGLSGMFQTGEAVTAAGGATGSVLSGGGTMTLVVESATGEFVTTELLTGGTSGATATINTVAPDYSITSLTVDPVTETTVWCTINGPRGGVYRSADSGATWALTLGQPGTDITCFAADPVSSTTYYAGTAGNGVWRTVDSGTNWVTMNVTIGAVEILDIVADERRSASQMHLLFVATSRGLFRSADRAATWNEVVDSAPVNPERNEIAAIRMLGLDPIAGNERVLWAATGGRGMLKITPIE